MNSAVTIPTTTAKWLIRISEVFTDYVSEIVADIGGEIAKKLGSEYYIIQLAAGKSIDSPFVRWKIPLEHAWPCNPEQMEGFIEKAAQAMRLKFEPRNPQAIFIGQIDPSAAQRYYKSLASNLRGRTLQLFPEKIAAFKEVEAQDPKLSTLFCLVGKEGLFCGMQSPAASNGFYPGGTKYISQSAPDTISRAGAKVAEALHYLLMHRPAFKKGSQWLELGASPGGMTSELLSREFRVTAIDRAPLDKRLDKHKDLNFALMDVSGFKPNASMLYHGILCDMNGDPQDSIQQVIRLSANLRPAGLIIFTLKSQGVTTFQQLNELYQFALKSFTSAKLRLIASTHLTYNRHELTVFLERDSPA